MSKENNKKAPNVRFPGFDGDWEERKYGDVIELLSGQDFNPEEYNEDGIGIPYLTGASCIENGCTTAVRWTEKPRCIAEKGDAVLVCKGSGYGTIATVNQEKAHIARQFMALKVKKYELDNRFNYFLLNSVVENIKTDARGLIAGIARDAVLKQEIAVPCLNEQRKISKYFSNLDRLITLHQRKLEKLKEYKKGMLQKMFPKKGEKVPEIRFPGFDGEWEERKVSELCSISTGKSNTQDKVEDGEYPFYVRSPIIERSTKYLYDEEAVITVGDGVGTGKVFHYVNGKYDLHQRCYRMYGFSDELNAHYFYHTFSKLFYKRVMAMTAKTSVDSVRLEMISDMKIPVPDIEEQRKIGSFLDNLDRLIALQQKKTESLKEFKKGCLQQMFV